MNILLVGATGNMGKTITEICDSSKEFNIVSGIGILNNNNFNYSVYEKFSDIKEKIDVVLDFSNNNLIDDILDYSVKNNKPTVISTTGYSKEQVEKIELASLKIPILYSGNMSIGINILLNTVKNLSAELLDFDIEIIEKHHSLKKDSPSGTAQMLFESVNEGRNNKLFEEYGRSGNNLSRKSNEVGVHSVRGGSITGEHTVIFSGLDEVVEITHKAQSKKVFALGALKACKFILNKNCGLYNMGDIFNF